MSFALRTVARMPNCFIGVHEHLVVLYWSDIASAAAVAKLREAFEQAKAARRPLLFLTYMEEKTLSAKTPADFRQALAQLLQDYNTEIAGSVIVLEKPGLKGALLRGIVTAINLVSKSSFPVTVEGSLEGGVSWLLRMTNEEKLPGASIIRVVRDAAPPAPPARAAS